MGGIVDVFESVVDAVVDTAESVADAVVDVADNNIHLYLLEIKKSIIVALTKSFL
jgi:hypothetical protein